MADFRCNMCGGTLEMIDEAVAICEYCGTKQTVTDSMDTTKKTSKISSVIKRWNCKRKERAKYCLQFPMHPISIIFFIICVILSLYFLCKEPETLTDMDCYLISICILFGSVIPFLTFLRFIKNKTTAIVLQGIVFIISINFYLTAVYYDVIEVLLMGLLAVIVQAIWLVLTCFAKKVERNSIKRTNKSLIPISALLVSAALLFSFELGLFSFLNYQYAKIFHKIGDYETSYKYFVYMGDYKNSEVLANKLKLLELKNSNIMDRVDLGYYYDGDGVAAFLQSEYENSSSWYVIAKEDSKVLLLNVSNVYSETKPTIIGGWEKSSLRRFLNEEYYISIFNDEIKNRIISTDLKNSASPNDITTDKIFILSKEEIEKYLPNESQRNYSHSYMMLRDTNDGVYNVLCDNSFEQVKFIKNEIDIVGYDQIGGAFSRFRLRTEINKIFNEAKFSPAMWIDISEIE